LNALWDELGRPAWLALCESLWKGSGLARRVTARILHENRAAREALAKSALIDLATPAAALRIDATEDLYALCLAERTLLHDVQSYDAALVPLLVAIGDDDLLVRIYSAAALSCWSSMSSAPAEAMRDREDISAEALYYLCCGDGHLGAFVPGVLPALQERARDPDPLIRAQALRCLGRANGPLATVSSNLPHAKWNKIGSQRKKCAESLDCLRAALSDPVLDVRLAALAGIRDFGDGHQPALADLIPLLHDPEPVLSAHAQKTLLESADPLLRQTTILEVLQHSVIDAREAVCYQLTADDLESAVVWEAVDRHLHTQKPEWIWLREQVLEHLGRLAREQPRALTLLIRRVQDLAEPVLVRAIEVVTESARGEPQVLAATLNCAAHANPDVRRAVGQALDRWKAVLVRWQREKKIEAASTNLPSSAPQPAAEAKLRPPIWRPRLPLGLGPPAPPLALETLQQLADIVGRAIPLVQSLIDNPMSGPDEAVTGALEDLGRALQRLSAAAPREDRG